MSATAAPICWKCRNALARVFVGPKKGQLVYQERDVSRGATQPQLVKMHESCARSYDRERLHPTAELPDYGEGLCPMRRSSDDVL